MLENVRQTDTVFTEFMHTGLKRPLKTNEHLMQRKLGFLEKMKQYHRREKPKQIKHSSKKHMKYVKDFMNYTLTVIILWERYEKKK